MKFKESGLAHRFLDGLEGLEIGGSAHNPFGLNTRNVDYQGGLTVFKQEEIKICGEALPVDIVAPGDDIPLPDNSVDFVISSHVIEHFVDPIKALKEWRRLVRPGGYIFIIAPHKERTFDKERPRTTLQELIDRHEKGIGLPDPDIGHCSVWVTQDFVDLIAWLGWDIVEIQDTDDKVGNGFTVVIRVRKDDPIQLARPVVQRNAVPAQPMAFHPQATSIQIPALQALAQTVQAQATQAQTALQEKRRATASPRTERPMSMTFLMGPTAKIRTGAAASILEYVRRFHELGHNVSLTTWPKFLWQGDEPFPGLGADIPVHYHRAADKSALPYHLLNNSTRDALGELQFFLAYMNLLTPAIPQADLLIAANWETVLPAWQSRKGKVVHFPQHYDEVFFTLDDAPATGFQGNALIKLLCRNAYQAPAYRIANSTWLAKELERRFGDKVPVVQHGVDTNRFRPLPKLSARDGIIRVVTCSRAEKWKGFQDAVPAMQELMRLHPNRIEWHVYGFAHPTFGPDNPVARYKFHGALEQEALSKLYAEGDIVLCPSWYESFPLPPIEAMACGTAVITTPYGTEDYAIDGHTAIVARPRAIADFVVALDGLVRNPELRERLGRNGRAIAESLSWDAAVEAREELLWRIRHNQMPCNGFRGLDNGLVDGNGIPFELMAPGTQAKEGELLRGHDGKFYIAEFGRLRRVPNPSALGLDPAAAAQLGFMSLALNEVGPGVTSLAGYYGAPLAKNATAEPTAAL